MKKRIKQIIGVIIGIIIGISTTVGATTIFNSKDITYSSDKTSKTNVKDSLDELYTNLGKCPNNKSCVDKKISEIVELGDYIRMTPTSTSYTPPGELTGCMNDANCTQNTLNPSELNLWRVIKKNDDGTVDAVSEHISSEGIIFFGRDGYINFVGGLNTIASQYTNEKYVAKARHVGYSNQTEKITDTSKLVQLDTAPWLKHTSMWNIRLCDHQLYLCGIDEPLGAGDIGYETDLSLIESVYGTLSASKVDGTYDVYWLASRRIHVANDQDWSFNERNILQNGNLNDYGGIFWYSNGSTGEGGHRLKVRPIITIKENTKIVSGDGKNAETSYKFE